MPRKDLDRAERELAELEGELAQRLIHKLNEISAGYDTLFFFTAEYNPYHFRTYMLSTESEELLKIARKTLELRDLLAIPDPECVGNLFLAACKESAEIENPHRLGPKRLASRLLSQIQNKLASS